MNDQNTGYFFTVGFKPYRVSLLPLKINSNWDWTKFGKKICVFSKLFIDEKDTTSTKFVLDSDFADGRKNTSKLLKKIKTLANMTPVRHPCLQLQKNFENFLFFSRFPRATENPSLSII